MGRIRKLLLLLAVPALFAAACGDDETTTTGDDGDDTAETDNTPQAINVTGGYSPTHRGEQPTPTLPRQSHQQGKGGKHCASPDL